MKKINYQLFIMPIAYFIAGILFCIFKGEVIQVLSTIIGIALIVSGIISILIVKNDSLRFTSNVLLIIIGSLLIILAWAVEAFITVVIGIIFIIYGVIKLNYYYQIKKNDKDFYVGIIVSILYIISGILLFFNKDVMYIILGIILIINGIIDFLDTLLIKRAFDNIKREVCKEKKSQESIDADIINIKDID